MSSLLCTSLSAIPSGREVAGWTGHSDWVLGSGLACRTEHVREWRDAAVHLGWQERNPGLYLSSTWKEAAREQFPDGRLAGLEGSLRVRRRLGGFSEE